MNTNQIILPSGLAISALDDEQRISRRIASAMTGVKSHTLAVWAMKGIGPRYTRLGGPRGRVVYRVGDIREWLAVRTFTSTAHESVSAADAGR